MNKTIKIGTRGSALALYQANKVKDELAKVHKDIDFEIVAIKTKGDIILDVALSKIGDKGLFTKEIENSLLANETDIAVHSLKDLPTSLPDGLKLGAVIKRAEYRDALVSKNGKKLSEFSANDKIATSSLRRKAQLLILNPNFNIVDIRGNVNTRLKKMNEGYCDGMIMAAAGLQRLGFNDLITEIIDEDTIIPAISQGAIAIENRENDEFIDKLIEPICHKQTFKNVAAERVFLKTLEGGCQTPIGCYSSVKDNLFSITGFISYIDGTQAIKETLSGDMIDAEKIAMQLAKSFIKQGAKEILEKIHKVI